jgi:hypothetical protein
VRRGAGPQCGLLCGGRAAAERAPFSRKGEELQSSTPSHKHLDLKFADK